MQSVCRISELVARLLMLLTATDTECTAYSIPLEHHLHTAQIGITASQENIELHKIVQAQVVGIPYAEMQGACGHNLTAFHVKCLWTCCNAGC